MLDSQAFAPWRPGDLEGFSEIPAISVTEGSLSLMDRVCPGIYPVPGMDILATGRAVLEKDNRD